MLHVHKFDQDLMTFVVLCLIFFLTPRAVTAQTYTVTDLGTLGGTHSAAFGLSKWGEVVGYSTTSGGEIHAFLYRRDGSLADLGTLGGRDSYAYRINDSGLLVGRSQTLSGEYHAFIAVLDSQMFDLSSLSSLLGGPFSTAMSVGNSFQVVGYMDAGDTAVSNSKHGAPHKRAFLYNDQNKVVDLGTFGGDDAIVTAVNDSGQITGYYTKGDHSGPYVAFLFSGGSVINLGKLGGYVPEPVDINNTGQVVGSVPTSSGEPNAFLYSGGSLSDLGTLPGGSQSFAYGINNLGQVVGASNSAATTLRAFLYSGGEMQDLNSLIPTQSGWTLTEARDINDAGQVVGTGLVNGQQRAFLLTPVNSALSSIKNSSGSTEISRVAKGIQQRETLRDRSPK
ncbi:MAG: DUF3466 family protein [Pyrinomonadaceae bacterium]|nr:DUF3466 family protein [Pyrinomonadaceae bacterium]